MKKIVANICTVWLLSYALASQAVVLSLEPDFQEVALGGTVDVGLDIASLGDGIAPSLGAFDLNVNYDAAILRFTDVTFGDPALGDLLALVFGSSTGFSDNPTTGVVNLFEVSLDFPSDLDLLQPASFTLATLSFEALFVGDTSLMIASNDAFIGDSLGSPLTPTRFEDAAVKVTAVPAPSSFSLLVLGLAMLGLLYRQFTF